MIQLTHNIRKRLNEQIVIEVIANNRQVIRKYYFNLDWETNGIYRNDYIVNDISKRTSRFYRGDYMINDDSRKVSFNYLIENDLIFLYKKTEAGSYTVSKDKRQNYHIYYTQLTLKSLLEVI